MNGKFPRKQKEVYTGKRAFLESTWGNLWKSVGKCIEIRAGELLGSIWVVRIHGKQVGNWEAVGEFLRKHKVNSWKAGTDFLETTWRGEIAAEQWGDFLKRKVEMPRK